MKHGTRCCESPIKLRHPGDGTKISLKRVGEQRSLVANFADLDGVVDVGNDRHPAIGDQLNRSLETPCVARPQRRPVWDPGVRRLEPIGLLFAQPKRRGEMAVRRRIDRNDISVAQTDWDAFAAFIVGKEPAGPLLEARRVAVIEVERVAKQFEQRRPRPARWLQLVDPAVHRESPFLRRGVPAAVRWEKGDGFIAPRRRRAARQKEIGQHDQEVHDIHLMPG